MRSLLVTFIVAVVLFCVVNVMAFPASKPLAVLSRQAIDTNPDCQTQAAARQLHGVLRKSILAR